MSLPPIKHKNLSTAPVEALESSPKSSPHGGVVHPLTKEEQEAIEEFNRIPVQVYKFPPSIKFKALHPSFQLPVKARQGDACYDVVAVDRVITEDYVAYKLGFATEISEGWQGLILPRSSNSKKDLLLCNSVGIVDSGYRGEWEVRYKIIPVASEIQWLANVTIHPEEEYEAYTPKIYEIGEKCAQIQFLPLPQYTLELVEELSESERGVGGFGSTNTK